MPEDDLSARLAAAREEGRREAEEKWGGLFRKRGNAWDAAHKVVQVRNENLVASLRADHKRKIDELLAAHDKRVDEFIADHDRRVTVLLEANNREVERRRTAESRIEALERAYSRLNGAVCQSLGRALNYPRFADDPVNFPGATPADGVCVGEHVAETLADEAAEAIVKLWTQVAEQHAALRVAQRFIGSGVEMGFIRMPDADTPDSAHDTLPAIEKALAGWLPTHRHRTRNLPYRALGPGRLQTETPLSDDAAVVIYQGSDGRLWARNAPEFVDGRFEPVVAL